MHTIVNHLPIKPKADWAEMAARVEKLAAGIRASSPEIQVFQLLKVSDTVAVFVISFDDLAGLQAFSSGVAGPWFGENLREFLSGPAARSVGEVVAGLG